MKSSTIVGALLVILAGAVVYFSIPPIPDEDYVSAILRERAEKDSFMKTASESPFAMGNVPFTPLEYFEPSVKFKVKAKLVRVDQPKPVVLPTSTGEQSSYLEYAWAEFDLDGSHHKLMILESMAAGPSRGLLFLPFADDTSTKETYGGGRYLDLKKIPGASSVELDFNKAYNPYCAYTSGYSCPFPPPVNILKIRIAAGEKAYHP